MKVKVFRFDPSVDEEGYFQDFDVDVPADAGWTVMDVLNEIRLNQDSSLSYYTHSACDHGICGRCTTRVDGRAVLICTHVVSGNEVTIEPLPNREVIKDLVTK